MSIGRGEAPVSAESSLRGRGGRWRPRPALAAEVELRWDFPGPARSAYDPTRYKPPTYMSLAAVCDPRRFEHGLSASEIPAGLRPIRPGLGCESRSPSLPPSLSLPLFLPPARRTPQPIIPNRPSAPRLGRKSPSASAVGRSRTAPGAAALPGSSGGGLGSEPGSPPAPPRASAGFRVALPGRIRPTGPGVAPLRRAAGFVCVCARARGWGERRSGEARAARPLEC